MGQFLLFLKNNAQNRSLFILLSVLSVLNKQLNE